jgi:hypothetical protein
MRVAATSALVERMKVKVGQGQTLEDNLINKLKMAKTQNLMYNPQPLRNFAGYTASREKPIWGLNENPRPNEPHLRQGWQPQIEPFTENLNLCIVEFLSVNIEESKDVPRWRVGRAQNRL